MYEIILFLLEKVLEAIYFSAFLIIGKNIKEKKLLFVAIMVFEYVVLKCFIQFNVWFQIIYTFITYINLKFLYKEKAQITDIFLFMVASLILILVSLFCGSFQVFFKVKYFYLLILNRIILFLVLIGLRNKINKIYSKYYSLWNRHYNNSKIKSLTLRNISIIVFNLMFYIINIGLIYAILTSK